MNDARGAPGAGGGKLKSSLLGKNCGPPPPLRAAAVVISSSNHGKCVFSASDLPAAQHLRSRIVSA